MFGIPTSCLASSLTYSALLPTCWRCNPPWGPQSSSLQYTSARHWAQLGIHHCTLVFFSTPSHTSAVVHHTTTIFYTAVNPSCALLRSDPIPKPTATSIPLIFHSLSLTFNLYFLTILKLCMVVVWNQREKRGRKKKEKKEESPEARERKKKEGMKMKSRWEKDKRQNR